MSNLEGWETKKDIIVSLKYDVVEDKVVDLDEDREPTTTLLTEYWYKKVLIAKEASTKDRKFNRICLYKEIMTDNYRISWFNILLNMLGATSRLKRINSEIYVKMC